MKTIKSKILVTLIIIFFIIGFSTSAKSIMDLPVFGPKESTIPTAELPTEINPLSVVYPENLEEHRFQTKEYVKSYSIKKREYIMHIFSKGEKYFSKAIHILDKYNVPEELQMIPVLESDFNSNAVSPVGAVGYWQFMAELAKEYGLRTNGKYDERKNFEKSTIAASRFFGDQLDYFHEDLLLAVASYNCGQGRVRLALKKSGKVDANFWDIKKYLPFETRKFVMDFIALNVIAANYDKFLDKKLDFNEPPLTPLIQIASTDSLKANDSLTVKAL
jgi:membrane-bound lytic murein transglycosylase D